MLDTESQPAASTAITIIDSTTAPLVGAQQSRAYDAAPVSAAERLKQWLDGLGPNTQRAYARDLGMVAAYMGEPGGATAIGAALDRLCAMPRARALTYIEGWRNEMLAAGLSSATINRRLAAVNSALREIAKADIGPGRLDMKGVKPEARKDTRGPAVGKVARAIEQLETSGTPRDLRDAVILRLGAQRGLRRSEIIGLTLGDLSLDSNEIRILRKGKREKVTILLAPKTADAIRRWLDVRSFHAAPECTALLVQISNRYAGGPLTDSGLFEVVRKLGRSVGEQQWRPHGLRHTAITLALKTTGNLEAARELAGHASVNTTQRYLDDKRDVEASAVEAIANAF